MIKVEKCSQRALQSACVALRKMIGAQWNGEQPIELLWRPWSDRRSRSQNALYRVWCRYIGDKVGRDEDDVHDLLRYRFLGHEPLEIAGEVIPRLVSTTTLTREEMSAYMLKVEVWAEDLGIHLPMPEDNDYMAYREAAR